MPNERIGPARPHALSAWAENRLQIIGGVLGYR